MVVVLNLRGEEPLDEATPAAMRSGGAQAPAPQQQQIALGRYLALVGNCAGCHTAPGGVAYAGGRGIETPFGTVYASNLTPDAATGIGSWTPAHFWRALHHGRSKDGRLLNPVFPYASYTHVSRADADAIHAWLRTLAPVAQPNREHALRWPYRSQVALAVWRALYFRPAAATQVTDASRPADWNRGAYLARGLGHCVECHSARNALGATRGGDEAAPRRR